MKNDILFLFYVLFSVVFLSLAAFPVFSYNIYNDSSFIYANTSNYNLVFTNTGILKDFYFNNSDKDIIGSDIAFNYDGFIFSLLGQEIIYFADNFSYTPNSVTFSIEYGPTYTYIFYDNYVEMFVNYSEGSPLPVMEFYMTYNVDELKSITNGNISINSTYGLFPALNWSNVTLNFNEGESISYYLLNSPYNVSGNIVQSYVSNASNTFTVMFDTSSTMKGNYIYSNATYLFNFTFNLSKYSPKPISRNISIANLTYNYNIITPYYNIILSKNGCITDFYFNNSDLNILFNEGYNINGMCFQSQGNILNVSSSIYDNYSVSFFNDIANFKYTFYENNFDLDLYVNQSYFIQFYFNPELSMFSKIYKTYSNLSFSVANNVSNFNWSDVSYQSIEGPKIRLFLKNHPANPFSNYFVDSGLNWYGNFRLFSFDSGLAYGTSFYSSGSNYTIHFGVDISNFSKIDLANYTGVSISLNNNSQFFVNTPNYHLFVDNDGIIRQLYFENSTRNMLGDNSQTGFDGIFLKIGSTEVTAWNCTQIKQNDIICFFDYGNYIYEFYNTSFQVQIDTTASAGFSKFMFTPNIDYLTNVSNFKNASQYVNLTDAFGQSENWTDAVFTTKENVQIRARMLYSPQKSLVIGYNTSPQIAYLGGQEIFTIGNDGGSFGGSNMYALDTYYASFDFNLDAFSLLPPVSYDVIIQNITGGFMIYAPDYRAFITNSGHLNDMYVMDSTFDIIGDNVNQDGIWINSSGVVLNATQSSILNNYTMQFSANNITWFYYFNDAGFNILVQHSGEVFSNIYFPIEISSFKNAYNLYNYSQSINLSTGVGGNFGWQGISYLTQEGIYIKIYLENQPVFSDPLPYYTYGKVYFADHKQIWTLNESHKMWRTNNYMYNFYLDTSEFNNVPYNTFTYTNNFDSSIGTSRYKLPSNYKSNILAPLVVVLHDINSTMDECFDSDLNTYLNFNSSYILLCPDVYGRLESVSNHTGFDLSSLKAQYGVISAINFAESNFNINPGRISVIGFGTGGALAIDVAAKRPDLFSGIATWNFLYNYSNFTSDINTSGNSYYYNSIINEIGTSNYTFEYQRRSPISYVSMLNYTPIWFYYNSSDPLYKKNYTIDFYNFLSNKGFNVTLIQTGLNSSNKSITPYNITMYYLNMTFKNSSLVNQLKNNTYTITDYSGNYFWYYVDVYYNPLGPDASDLGGQSLFSTVNASFYNGFLNLSLINIKYFMIPSCNNILNLTVVTNQPATFLVQNANLTVYNSSNAYFDASYNLFYISSRNGFVYNPFSFTVPFVYSATCPMISSSFNSSILNSTFNVTGSCTVTFDVPTGYYNNYNIFEGNNFAYQGNSLMKTVNIFTNTSILLLHDDIPPSINYISPTPVNNTLYQNRSPSFIVKANISEYVNLCNLHISSNLSSNVYSMAINNSYQDYSTCEYNVTVLSDHLNYTYYVEARDNGLNTNYSSNRTIGIGWNNPPTGNITFINFTQIAYTNSPSYKITWTGCYNNTNCTDLDRDLLNYSVVVNGSLFLTTHDNNATLSFFDGNYSVAVYVGDSEFYYPNYVNVSTGNFTLIIDTIPPMVNITYPVSNANYTTNSFSLSYNYTDANSMYDCNYSLNSQTTVLCSNVISALQGTNNLTVFVHDIAFNSNNKSISFFVDSIPPSINVTFPLDGLYYNNSNITISYIPYDSNGIKNCSLYLNYVLNQTHNFTFSNDTFNLSLLDGDYTLGIMCYDNYLNPTTISRLLHIDTHIPNISLTFPLNISYGPKYANISYIYNDPSPMLNCGYYLDSFPYLCNVQINMTQDGFHNLNLYVSDAANNFANVSVLFLVNSTPPNIAFNFPTPLDNSTTNLSYVFINSSFDKPISVCKLEFDNINHSMNYVFNSNSSVYYCYYNITGLLDHTNHTYKVYANDSLSNMNVSVLRTINIKWNNPPYSFSLVSPVPNFYINNLTVNLTWNAAFDPDNDFLNYTVYINSGSYLTNNTSYLITLSSEKSYVWNVTSFDGQYYNYSDSRSFTIDVTNPQLTLSSPISANYTSSLFLISYSTNEPVTSFYSINGGANQSCINYAYYSGYQGYNNFTLYLYDLAGNMNSSSVIFLLDSISPSVFNIFPLNNSFIADYNATISFNITDANRNICYLYINNTLNATFDVSNTTFVSDVVYFNNSIIRYYVKCMDKFGNYNTTRNYTITFDTIPPNVTLYSPINTSYSSTNIPLNYTSTEQNACFYNLNNVTYGCLTPLQVIQGWNNFSLFVNDSAGNYNIVNSQFYVDSFAPSFYNVSPSNGNRTRFENNIISFGIFDISNVTCGLYVNGIINLTIINNSYSSNKLFSFPIIFNNTINWYVNCTDFLFNSNVTSLRNFTVDAVAPVINLISPVNKSFLNNLTVLLNYTATKNNVCEYALNGVTFSCTPTFTAIEGNNTFSIRVYDDVGNVGEINLSFFIDVNPPSIISYYPDDGLFGPSSTMYFNYSVNDVSNVPNCDLVIINRSTTIMYNISKNVSLSFIKSLFGGTFKWYILCYDVAGNYNQTPVKILYLDLSSPYVQLSSTSAKTGEYLYLIISDYNLTIANYTLDGKDYVLNASVQNDYFNISFDTLNWTKGIHSLDVTAKDEGVFNITHYDINITKQIPSIIINYPYEHVWYNNNTFNISTIYNIDQLFYSVNGGLNITYNGTLNVGPQNFTIVSVYNLSQGQNIIFFNFNDTLRNRGNESFTFYLDSEPPLISHTKYSDMIQNTTYVFKYYANDLNNVTNCSIIIYANYTYANYTVIFGINSNITKLTGYNFTYILNDGDISYDIYCFDNLGNLADINFTNFTIDLYAPIINISNLSIQPGQNINITIFEHNITDAWYFFNGQQIYFNKTQIAKNIYFANINTTVLPNGFYPLVVQAKDNFRTTYINTSVEVFTSDLVINSFSTPKTYYYVGDSVGLFLDVMNRTSILQKQLYDVLPNGSNVIISNNFNDSFNMSFSIVGAHILNVTMLSDNGVFSYKSLPLLIFGSKLNQTFFSENNDSIDIYYNYGNTLLEHNVTNSSIIVEIPNSTLNLTIAPDNRFLVSLNDFLAEPDIPLVVNYSSENLGFVLNNSNQNTLFSYTFSIDNYSLFENKYEIMLNYSGITSYDTNFSVYKTDKYFFGYNVTLNQSYFNDTLNQTMNESINVTINSAFISTEKILPIYINNVSHTVAFYVFNFSQFVLAQTIFESPIYSSPVSSGSGQNPGGNVMGGMPPILGRIFYLNFINQSTYNFNLMKTDKLFLIFNNTYNMTVNDVNITFDYTLFGKNEISSYNKSYSIDGYELDISVGNISFNLANVTFFAKLSLFSNLTNISEILSNSSGKSNQNQSSYFGNIIEGPKNLILTVYSFIKEHFLKPLFPNVSGLQKNVAMFYLPSMAYRILAMSVIVILIVLLFSLSTYAIYPFIREKYTKITTRQISQSELENLQKKIDILGRSFGEESPQYKSALSNIEVLKIMGTNKDFKFYSKIIGKSLENSFKKIIFGGSKNIKFENNPDLKLLQKDIDSYTSFRNLKHSAVVVDDAPRKLNLIVPGIDETGKNPVFFLKEKYSRLADVLSQARKQGFDTMILDIKFNEIMPQIELFDATKEDKDYINALEKINEIENYLLNYC